MRIPTLEEKVDAILRILNGEPLDPKDEGLMGEMRDLKGKLLQLIDWKNKTVAWALGVSFGGGALVAFVVTTVLKK